MHGNPDAIASHTANPKPSDREVNANISRAINTRTLLVIDFLSALYFIETEQYRILPNWKIYTKSLGNLTRTFLRNTPELFI
jgi:hypothetical protein